MVIQGDEENSIEFCFELLRNDYKRSPPSSNSMLGGQCQDFVSKLNVFFRFRDMRPIAENGRPPSHRLYKGSDLVGSVLRIEIDGCLGIPSFPSPAIAVHPSCKSFSRYTHLLSVKMFQASSTFAQSCTAFHS